MVNKKVFSNNKNRRVTEIVEDTLQVGSDGSVTFRAAEGKGSGRAIQIPGEQFDEFVNLLSETANRRISLAEQAVSDDDTISNDEVVES